MSFADYETCPRGTQKLLETLGYSLSPDRCGWVRSRSCISPASQLLPDRLACAAAAQVSEIELKPDNSNLSEKIDDGIHRRLTGEKNGNEQSERHES